MSYLQRQMNMFKYDRRLLEHNLKTGLITQDDYQKHLQELRDQSDNIDVVELVSEQEKEEMNGSAESSHENPADDMANQSAPQTDPLGSGY